MSKDIKLLDSLIENDSIHLNLEASDWKEAVRLSINPLIKSGAVEKRYIESIFRIVKEFGPYFILSDDLAMPHARPEDGVNKNAFSLITLKNAVKFDGDNRAIKVFIALAASSADIHVSVAIPQIIEIFGDDDSLQAIKNAKTKDEVIKIIKLKLGGKHE